jgi:hypothetical protein
VPDTLELLEIYEKSESIVHLELMGRARFPLTVTVVSLRTGVTWALGLGAICGGQFRDETGA